MKEKLADTASDTVKSLSILLALAFVASLLASLSWVFDLFSNFVIQYAIGGIVLAPLLLYFKRPLWAAAVLFVALYNGALIYQYHQTYFSPPV